MSKIISLECYLFKKRTIRISKLQSRFAKNACIFRILTTVFLRNIFVDIRKHFRVVIYLFQVDSGNTRTMCKICSKLEWSCTGVIIVNFEQISHIVRGCHC